ncbi:dihydrodipicolinate synthase family protein [Variovorax sp. J22G21]|uniref:dihydrodipicolinate synthase family protein n=1 Tax=Variovorax fucosicus TaxID=3053517 RepID=UPI0025757799|nr:MULTISPECIES: dihydrodipicolinate synthase family protein [unclassified Variovorax]MDM0040650.1 dihydrodipicolinate synthase family protein [Variovorax sp. J22R193]MDM0062023.1 dihydrodipicolinate synthase family protein [Variovorax sp. J22G21]
MIPDRSNAFHGIYAATLCPLLDDGRIDETTLARHLEANAFVPGMAGLLINGHAGENFMLSREEKRRVAEIAAEVCGRRSILVSGINAEDSFEAQRHVDDAKAAGADAVLLFPPFSWALSQDEHMAVTHHRIANANAQMPLMLYQAGVNAGAMAYRPEVLAELAQLPHVVGIKEGSWEAAAYEASLRLVKRVAPHVAMMASGDEHLFTCFLVGSEGSLVSLAAVTPELVIALEQAIRRQDLDEARRLNDRIYPLAKAIYGTAPGGYATARLKTCLKLLGRIPSDTMRLPMGPLPAAEVTALERALAAAGVHA